MSGLDFEAAVLRLAALAAARSGTLAATDVETDETLAGDPATTSAAARMLASGSDVVAEPTTGSERWFPYARLTFTQMSGSE